MYVLASGSSVAAEISSTFNASVGRSDNILRTDDNQVEESMATVGIELDATHNGPKLTTDIHVNADYIEYVDGSFDNEVLGGANIVANYWFLEDKFGWNLQYNYGQQVFNPLAPIRPDNRENVSFVTTGPQLIVPLGARFELKANAEISETSYEINPNDSQRVGGRASIGRLMSSGRTLSLVGTQERVEYDININSPDYDRRAAFLRFESINTRGSFAFDIGVNELQLDGIDEKTDGTFVRLDWTRILSEGIELTITGGSRFSDQGDIFRFFRNVAFDLRETEDVAGVQTPFQNNYGSLALNLERARTSIDLVAIYSDEDYELNSNFDRLIKQFNLLINRDLSRKLFGEFGVNTSSRRFGTNNRDDRDTLLTLAIGFRFNEAASTTLSYQHFSRNSNQGVTEFDENRIFLRFSYVPKWAR